jgi:signal transduction histidine kinase
MSRTAAPKAHGTAAAGEGTPVSRERFSAFHAFSRAEVEQTVAAVAHEARAKRMLVKVTTAHRQNAIHQWVLNQLAFGLTVAALFLAEVLSPSVVRATLYIWLLACAVNWALRALLYFWIFRAPPAEVSRRLLLRSLPLAITLLSTGHWIWSVQLLVTPAFTPTVIVMYVGFVMLTIAGIGNLLVTPLAAGAYVGGLWLGLSIRVWQVGLMPWGLVLVIDVCMASILWLCIHMTVKRLQLHLDRSDEIDLLLAKLKRSNAELASLKDDAAATLVKRSSFFAGASHDFKQRLHAMKLMLHASVSDVQEHSTLRWTLTRLSEEVGELENFIAHFLAFARIEALSEKPDLQEVRLLDLFQQLDLRFEELASSQAVRLRFHATRVRVRTDTRLLLQMIENLVSNALKFTRGSVLVAARRRAGGIAIEVWDQGIGIDPDQQPRIFEAFHQAPDAASRDGRGVGLGLAVVKRFADLLGLTVAVSSRPGLGSVFRIQVPVLLVLPDE